MPISFFADGVNPALRNRRALKKFLREQIILSRPAFQQIDLAYVFVTDEALLRTNQQFLNHDTYTDIITFPLAETADALDGEIHISTERVAENAKEFGQSYQRELHRVLFHGALHLCGLRDKTKKEQEAMRAAEDAWLAAYEAATAQTL